MNVETQSARIIDAAANGGSVPGFEEVSALLTELGSTTPVAPGAALAAPGVAAATAISAPGIFSAGVVLAVKVMTASCLLAGLVATAFFVGEGSAGPPPSGEIPSFDRPETVTSPNEGVGSPSVPGAARQVSESFVSSAPTTQPVAAPPTPAPTSVPAGPALLTPTTSPITSLPTVPAVPTTIADAAPTTSVPLGTAPVAVPEPAEIDGDDVDESSPPPAVGNNGNGNSNGNGVGNGKGNNGKRNDR